MSYPVAQLSAVGFVRSPLDRQKLYDWMTELTHKSMKFGQVAYTENSQENVDKVAS